MPNLNVMALIAPGAFLRLTFRRPPASPRRLCGSASWWRCRSVWLPRSAMTPSHCQGQRAILHAGHLRCAGCRLGRSGAIRMEFHFQERPAHDGKAVGDMNLANAFKTAVDGGRGRVADDKPCPGSTECRRV